MDMDMDMDTVGKDMDTGMDKDVVADMDMVVKEAVVMDTVVKEAVVMDKVVKEVVFKDMARTERTHSCHPNGWRQHQIAVLW